MKNKYNQYFEITRQLKNFQIKILVIFATQNIEEKKTTFVGPRKRCNFFCYAIIALFRILAQFT